MEKRKGVGMKEYSIIGKAIPNVDAIDIRFPNMLVGKILRSRIPHARILHIDTSKAKRIVGVRAVLTAEDTPKIKYGGVGGLFDKLILEDEKVRCIGDEIAAVAGIDEDTANEALEMIKVHFEELPAVYDPEKAMLEDAPRIHEHLKNNISISRLLNYGNVDKAFEEAYITVEDEFRTPAQSHCCIEIHNVVAKWDSRGRVTIWASTQSPHILKNSLARVCNLLPSQIQILKPHIGGGFGSKGTMNSMDGIAVLLARASGSPVRIENSREEEFFTVAPRHPTINSLKFGFDKNGKITAKQAKVIMDNGAYNLRGPAILAYNCVMFSTLYNCPNIKYQGYLVYTNKIGMSSFRGFGVPQAMFGHEVMMDMAAEKLGMDPKDIRLLNVNLPNEITGNKIKITSCGLKETIQSAVSSSNYDEKRRVRSKGYGIGMACMVHTGAASNTFGANYSAATIKLNTGGSVTLSTGASDIGQGSNTVLLQIAAEVLGLSTQDIQLVVGDTDETPPDLGAVGSRTTFCAGTAVLKAAEDLRSKILNVASKILDRSPDDIRMEGKIVFAKQSPDRKVSFAEIGEFGFFKLKEMIIGNGFFIQEKKDSDPLAGWSYESPAMIFGTQVAEVEVDEETGWVRVKRVTSAHDLGRAINPILLEGQVEGGVVQGLGWALSEGVVFEGGRFLNANLTDYKLFTSMDAPKIDSIWIETDDPNGPFGSKGISEGASIPTASAIVNAIYNAIGVRCNSLPIAPEQILKAIKKRNKVT
jgi:CO/xanthine dehydrogenase Mo-binding subunit